MSTSTEICHFFFEEGENYRFKCKICGNERKQSPGTGYSNLMSHLTGKNPTYRSDLGLVQRSSNGSIESHGFVTERTSHHYQWMRWVVERNLLLCEVDDPLTRFISKLCPTSSKTLKLAMETVARKVGVALANDMGDKLGLVFDGWTSGSAHFITLFAVYVVDGQLRQPLLAISPLDEGSQSADAHLLLFKNVLSVYSKRLEMVLVIVGDNCNTNRAIAIKMGIPLVSCSSYRLNLSVRAFTADFELLLEQVNALVTQLRQLNNSAEFAKFTTLRPIKRNVIRWSSTFEMLQRYLRIRCDIKKVEAVEEWVPSGSSHRKLVELHENLAIFDSVCKKLQNEATTMADSRLLFDSLVQRFGDVGGYLGKNAKIVQSPIFENATIKVAHDTSLTPAETKSVKAFALASSSVGEKRKAESDDFATSVLRDGAVPRRTDRAQPSYIPLLTNTPPPPTSNVCERLFSQSKLVLTPQRGRLAPASFEILTFLRVNRLMWNASTLSNTE